VMTIDKFTGEKERVPALKLRNEVLWVNENILLPFDIKKGQESDLALFFDKKGVPADFRLGIRNEHFRSGDIGKVVFRDKEGRLYRDIDLKGCGALRPLTMDVMQWHKDEEGRDFGLMDRKDAENDTKYSELFTKEGIRTHRSLAIFKLKELPEYDASPSLRTLDELRASGALEGDIEPVIQMRAFGMKARVADATQKVIYIEDAVQLLSHERGIDVSTPDTYARWFAKTLGSNIGKVHALGYIHGHMTAQNVTLDCRLVDLDSVEPTADLNEQVRTSIVETDVADGQEALGSLLKTLMHYFPQQISPLTQDELFRIYKDSYEEVQRS